MEKVIDQQLNEQFYKLLDEAKPLFDNLIFLDRKTTDFLYYHVLYLLAECDYVDHPVILYKEFYKAKAYFYEIFGVNKAFEQYNNEIIWGNPYEQRMFEIQNKATPIISQLLVIIRSKNETNFKTFNYCTHY
jgi:hypothetical protein